VNCARWYRTEKTDELLPQADHVVNILPANAGTERFIDRRRIGLMKPTAIFYNIGRGNTVEQPALLEALQKRKIAGAYLDVTDPEPRRRAIRFGRPRTVFITRIRLGA